MRAQANIPSFRLAAVLLVVGLLASCSPGGDTAAADASPTFRRINDEVLQPTEPVSQVADIQQPTVEGEPWRVVGSLVAPDTGVARAAVWSSDNPPEWKLEELDPGDNDVSEAIEAVAPFDGSLLAVGRVGDGDESDGALWRLRDGDWKRITPPEMAGEHGQLALHVAVGESGVLVAGGETAWGDVRPRLWFSEDGENWRTVDGGAGGPFDATGEESVSAITAFGAGFVAVGRRDLEGNQDGMVWFSPDGVTWEQVDAPILGGEGRQNLESVVLANGTLVAGGYVSAPDGQGQPGFWTSTDGRGWNPAAGALPLHATKGRSTQDMSVTSLTMNGAQITAAGGSDPMPHLWTSDDSGATWFLQPNPVERGAELFKDGVGLIEFAGSPTRMLALSEEPTVLALQGDRWADATGDDFPKGGDRPNATSVVLNDDGTVLAGGFSYNAPHDDVRERFSGRIWVGNGNDVTAVEPSDEQPDLGVGHVTDIAAFKGGYVAVGVEDFSTASRRGRFFDSNPDGVLWTSPDGTAWSRQAAVEPRTEEDFLRVMPDADPAAIANAVASLEFEAGKVSMHPAGGRGTQTLQAVDRLGDGYIAVGRTFRDADGDGATPEYDIDPIVLTSPDGVNIQEEVLPNYGGAGTQRLEDVCVTEDGRAIAVGVTGSGQNLDVVIFLRGIDGVWTPSIALDDTFGGAGGQRAAGCAATDDGFLVVGSDDARGNVDARVWSSEDGMGWNEVQAGSLGGNGNQTAIAAAPVPDGGWLVGGTDSASGDSDIALWRILDDGQVRRRDREEPSLAGAGEQRLTALYVSDKRTVLVGNDDRGVGIWETSRLDR